MAKGDRVVVGDGYYWKESDNQKVMAYMPTLDESKNTQTTPDGGVIVSGVGGVSCGASGTVQGDVIDVHRSYLPDQQAGTASIGGTDFVQLLPVFLDKYQRLGYFPVDHVRIFGGE